jgi:hypothetical protein
MSTVRIQVRRGTASEWTTANPILAAGEMGVETNTNKFKFGNGTDAWSSLSYAASDSAAIGEISQDAINTALSMGSGLTKTYDDGANTITINVDTNVVATKAFATSEATSKADAAEAAANDYTDTAVNGVNSSLTDYLPVADRGVANGVASLNGSGKVPESELQLVGLTTSITTSGHISADDITVAGDLIVNGTTTTLNTQNYTVADPMIYIGEDNHSNQLDLGFVASHDDGTYNHTGLVRDASVGKWKLFKGVTDEPTTTVNFAQGSLDDLLVNYLDAEAVTTGDLTVNGFVTLPASSIVTSAILDGAVTEAKIAVNSVDNQNIKTGAVATTKLADSAVTSAKLADNAVTAAKLAADAVTTVKIADDSITAAKLQSDSVTAAKIANNAVTEAKITNASVTQNKIADNAVVAGKIAAGTVVNADISNTAAIAQSKIDGLGASLDLLAPKAAPTFTGTVTLPATTSIGTVSSTEIGYVDGVTSSIQTQLDAKAASSTVTAHTGATTNVHGIADTAALATKTYVDNAGAALQTNIDAKAPIANPTFTGTVAGITKTMVGLANVDNTSDANKPVSTATQTALDLKAPKAAPTFTGTLTAADVTISGNLTVSGTTTTVNTTNFTTSDPVIYLGNGNNANLVDIGFVGSYNDGTYAHQGLVKDSSDNKWKLFKGITDEPTTTLNFAQGSLDALAVGALEATTVTPSAGIVFSDKTQTKAGVPSLTAIATAVSTSTTLDALGTDAAVRDSLVPLSGAVNVSFEATGNAKYAIGSSINFYQSSGTGANITGNGITILSTPGSTLRTTYSSVTATKIAATTWLLAGDLKA